MKFLLLLLLFINMSFANSQNISRMNALKKVIQKEEYIALAVNKYILQTGTIPKTDSNLLDWTKLEVKDYLGSDFNRTNPLTSEDIYVYYDTDNNQFFIRGVVVSTSQTETSFDSKLAYLYNFYSSRIFRVNTLAPHDTTEDKLLKGSQIIYSSVQKEIVKVLNLVSPEINTIKLDSQECSVGTYYYELKGEKLTLKYCKSDDSVTVYQESPIYVEDIKDLQYIKVKIGDVGYAKYNGSWYEYYYQGDTSPPWIPQYLGTTLTSENEDETVEDLILSYIPDAKDLVFRQDGGCMLANGDIFCWGNNQYKKAGIENYGQLDTSLSPDYVNTPVMLKVQIDKETKIGEETRNSKKWYNNPFRVKFEKMAMNSTNVCGLSPIFRYTSDGISKKVGGDLFCNGRISSTYFEDLDDDIKSTSILKKNKYFAVDKTDELNNNNEIYLEDLVMVEDTIIVLSDAGNLYTLGRNYKGALGINSSDKFKVANEPIEIDNDGTIFKNIFALRDIKTIGAIDENNNFWIWGERPNGTVFYKPTLLDTTARFNKDAIFVNSSEFILKSVNNVFYKTKEDRSIEEIKDSEGNLIPSSALSVSIYKDSDNKEFYLYANEDLVLKGSDTLLKCMQKNETSECTANANKTLFKNSIDELNDIESNSINDKKFANFANVSIFKLDSVLQEEFEDFETSTSGWVATNSADNNLIKTVPLDTTDTTNQEPVTNFLGRFPTAVSQDIDYYEVSKTYSFNSKYANYEVEIEFDFYEIDTWDGERFEVYANGDLLAVDHFIFDNHDTLSDSNITGTSLQDNINTTTTYAGDQSYKYKLKAKLDENAEVALKFKTQFEYETPYVNQWSNKYVQNEGEDNEYLEDVENESWGIDNVHIKVKDTNKKFVCTMTGIGSESQMYCWGNVDRSIPVLSTSLYEMDKISSINKLFITQESDKKDQMTYNQYNSSNTVDGVTYNKLFLKFPTYIGGFDYGFYFK